MSSLDQRMATLTGGNAKTVSELGGKTGASGSSGQRAGRSTQESPDLGVRPSLN